MHWNRKLRRYPVHIDGVSYSLEEYLQLQSQKLPKITISGKPMNHLEGLKNCCISATSMPMLAENIWNYTQSVYRLWNQLDTDAREFEERHKGEGKEFTTDM